MSENEFPISKELKEFFKKWNVQIWDEIELKTETQNFQGVILPRYELARSDHLSIKLKTGYNIGIPLSNVIHVEKIGHSEGKYKIPVEKLEKDFRKPKIVILGCGGTIASRIDYRTGGVIPAITPEELQALYPEINTIANISTKILFEKFSEDLDLSYWMKVIHEIRRLINEEKVDGIVVAHGTDTMSYAAATLALGLQGVPIPVLITGSQRSSDRPSSDSFRNLADAVFVAASGEFTGVALVMHSGSGDETGAIHNPCRVRKMHTSRRDAFQSIGTKPWGQASFPDRTITWNIKTKKRSKKCELPSEEPKFEKRVALVITYPGITASMLEALITQETRGIVISGTGLGHAPKQLLPSIRQAIDKGIIVVMTSQCLNGYIGMNVYDRGRELLALGVIPGGDLLPETALIKLAYALGQGKTYKEQVEIFKTNIVGEYMTKEEYEVFPIPTN
ncbi:MAG: Glu-tRNA(Gln) amidotransferase subunit GatD [Candidatus Hermodarchaeota archaeon]